MTPWAEIIFSFSETKLKYTKSKLKQPILLNIIKIAAMFIKTNFKDLKELETMD